MIATHSGLRERKRRATENAIEEAAVSLAVQQGPESVTVAEICRRAEVSRGTFFNYFPSREAAVFGRPIHLVTGAPADGVLERYADNLPLAAFHLTITSIGHANMNSEVARGRQQLLAGHPEAGRITSASLSLLQSQLVAAVQDWLERHPERCLIGPENARREALLTIGAASAAAVVMADGWPSLQGDVPMREETFLAALEDLGRVVGVRPPETN
ncbi:TetR/AcrR family transcriptional regulator [Arthrobacter sp.]|uniref:TetR/AcrR family transcriptional regulator n=1 Tax=Arthrobacter sp. TaxID=1667 RepID=UPI00289AFBDF|nr:TetR/AcrR family transcriptional regulator [Arthrobacter sp.]